VLVTLDAPYADTTAADLSFALDLAEQPALSQLDLAVAPGFRLQLRLLGASHQVVLDTPAGRLTETVACLPSAPAGLPDQVTSAALPAATRYTFRANVQRLPAAALRAEVARLREHFVETTVLAGLFPGSPDALTLLAAQCQIDGSGLGKPGSGRRPRGTAWWTVHAYPQSGELVRTATTVRVK
jgi:hypothetical protein